MVLSAKDLGIKDRRLVPAFCSKCGNRMGWTYENVDIAIYCEECSRELEEGEDDN